jgi:hypothetical protein
LKIASARSRASFSLSAKRSLPNIFENCARDAVAPDSEQAQVKRPDPPLEAAGRDFPNRTLRAFG